MPASVTVKDNLLDIKEFVRLKKKTTLRTRTEMSGKKRRNNFY